MTVFRYQRYLSILLYYLKLNERNEKNGNKNHKFKFYVSFYVCEFEYHKKKTRIWTRNKQSAEQRMNFSWNKILILHNTKCTSLSRYFIQSLIPVSNWKQQLQTHILFTWDLIHISIESLPSKQFFSLFLDIYWNYFLFSFLFRFFCSFQIKSYINFFFASFNIRICVR